jgi:hypothetical protein
MQTICIKNETETWIANNEAIDVSSFDLQLICADYGLETFRASCDKIRSTYNHSV